MSANVGARVRVVDRRFTISHISLNKSITFLPACFKVLTFCGKYFATALPRLHYILTSTLLHKMLMPLCSGSSQMRSCAN